MIDHIFLALFLGACSFFDLKTRRIGGGVLATGAVLSLGLCVYGLITGEKTVLSVLLGLLVGGGAVAVSLATKEKLGLGDALVLCISCPLVGALEGLVALLLSFIIAAFFSAIGLLIKKFSLKHEIPFIPFLLAGMTVMVVTA